MSKEDVINYVMTTPSNPNRAVLEGMLDGISGTQLPSPTESDNGKVLGVENGEYALVEQSGGGTLIIRVDNEASTAEKAVFDKTWQEVYDALKNGTRVIILSETTLPPGIATLSITTAANNTAEPSAPYQIYAESRSGSTIAIADTADGYLYISVSGGGSKVK